MMAELTDVSLHPRRGILLAGLVNLEPLRVGRGVLVASGVAAESHVRHEWAGVVWPLHHK